MVREVYMRLQECEDHWVHIRDDDDGTLTLGVSNDHASSEVVLNENEALNIANQLAIYVANRSAHG